MKGGDSCVSSFLAVMKLKHPPVVKAILVLNNCTDFYILFLIYEIDSSALLIILPFLSTV